MFEELAEYSKYIGLAVGCITALGFIVGAIKWAFDMYTLGVSMRDELQRMTMEIRYVRKGHRIVKSRVDKHEEILENHEKRLIVNEHTLDRHSEKITLLPGK